MSLFSKIFLQLFSVLSVSRELRSLLFSGIPARLRGMMQTAFASSAGIILLSLSLLVLLLVFLLFRYRKVVAALRESETRFRTTVLHSEAGYFFIDNNGIIRDVNTAWLKLYGYDSPREILGQNFTIFQTTGDVEKAREVVYGLLSGKHSYLAGEFSRKIKSGGQGYHTFSARPVFQHGKIIGIEGFIIDSTARRQAEEAIRESERMLNRSQTIAHIGHWTWDVAKNKVSWSDEMFRIFGINRENFTGSLDDITATAIHPDDRGRVLALNQAVMNQNRPESAGYRVVHPDGSVHYVWAQPGDRVTDSAGKIIYLSGIVQDITERKQVENALRESETQYYELFNNMSAAVAVYDVEGDGEYFLFRDFNRAGLEMEKVTKQDIIGKRVSDVFPGVVEFGLLEVLKRVWKTGIPEYFPAALYKDKRIGGWRDNYVYKLPSGVIVTVYTDETARKQAEAALQISLEEKTILLKEVHHRVKNNLQIVSSLVSLQANHTRNREARAALQETGDRIRSMSMLHETLYKLDIMAYVDFSTYITNICTYLMQSYGTKNSGIQLEHRLDKTAFTIDQAISCGLIINELVSNAFKHAFPGRKSGQIIVEVKILPDNKVVISVADDGIGVKPGMDFRQTGTLGFELVNILIDKLNGSLEIDHNRGTAFHISFLPKKIE